ncbi:hypothetical protein NQ317_008500 [Molorchus minor]|uniref:Uncharacterized protein n=1 Tax=Molorchus minor TaxID=1323400 RepID=A0ABQ9JLG9_9CUCU|nr:hypothetical protein NQ317_008500 [Molorchus minor]
MKSPHPPDTIGIRGLLRSQLAEGAYLGDSGLFVDTIQKGFSLGILIQIFASVLVFCFTGFQMIIIPIQSVQFVSLLIYFTCMMAQVAMYCWFGHYLIDSSDSIINSLYMSNWYEADTSLKRSIFIFMERCKKPVILRAGNLFPLSLVTFTSVSLQSFGQVEKICTLTDGECLLPGDLPISVKPEESVTFHLPTQVKLRSQLV